MTSEPVVYNVCLEAFGRTAKSRCLRLHDLHRYADMEQLRGYKVSKSIGF